jgi:hypothetical protein
VSGASTTEIVRLELSTGAIWTISGLDDSEPAFPPPSAKSPSIALRSFRAGHADVILEGLDGSAPFQLTDDEPSDGAPAFAPTF